MSPDLLCTIGEALYGERWTGQLADALGLPRQVVDRWSRGDRPVPAGRLAQIGALVVARKAELARIELAL